MSEDKTSQQLIDILKPLSVEKRIDTIFDLFENPELFKNEETSELSGFLQLALKDGLSTKIYTFLTLLYKIENLEKEELEKVISENIDCESNNSTEYIEKIKLSLEYFYDLAFEILKDKLIESKSTKQVKKVDETEKYISQADLINEVLKGSNTSLINNLIKLGHFKNRRLIDGKQSRYEMPWSDVDEYVKTARSRRTDWEKYKSEHQW